MHRWDWDNTPTNARSSFIGYPNELNFVDVPILPHWLEDELRFYENQVEKILERLNPVRDAADRLIKHETNKLSLKGNILSQCAIYQPELSEFVKQLPEDSPEVKEFERIVNAYREIPGFVEEVRQDDISVLDDMNRVSAALIAQAYNVPSSILRIDWAKQPSISDITVIS